MSLIPSDVSAGDVIKSADFNKHSAALRALYGSVKLLDFGSTPTYVCDGTEFLLLGDDTGGDIVVTLPHASQALKQILVIKTNSAGNTIEIDPASGDSIEDNPSLTITDQWQEVWLIAGGVNTWYILKS